MCLSEVADVRVNRGSMWMTLAPLSLRLGHPLVGDRVALGHVRALDDDAVSVGQVLHVLVAPPRPNEDPRLGTVEECQIRAWFSIWIAPAAVKSFLMR